MLSVREVPEYDVVVVGSGPAGACAALEATARGARVLVVSPRAEDSTVEADALVYLGGGTRTQEDWGIEDSSLEMYSYLLAVSAEPDRALLQEYSARSAEHHDWIVETMGGDCARVFVGVEQAGNELVWPHRSMAAPAARGHRFAATPAHLRGMLRARVERTADCVVRGRVQSLVRSGRGFEIALEREGRPRSARARSVVLAPGRWGPGPHALVTPFSPGSKSVHEVLQTYPDQLGHLLPSGVVVDTSGRRFVSEDSRLSRLAQLVALRPGGRAFLLVDHRAAPFAEIEPLGTWAGAAEAEAGLGLPSGSLVETILRYDACARQGEDPDLHKLPELLRELGHGPLTAYDLSVADLGPGLSMAGWRTTPGGQLLDDRDRPVSGVYAAGVCAAGVVLDGETECAGLELGTAILLGRRAGAAATRAAAVARLRR